MSIQPDHALLDVLRASLHKAETDPRPATPASDELKRLLRKRIAELESVSELLVTR